MAMPDNQLTGHKKRGRNHSINIHSNSEDSLSQLSLQSHSYEFSHSQKSDQNIDIIDVPKVDIKFIDQFKDDCDDVPDEYTTDERYNQIYEQRPLQNSGKSKSDMNLVT